MGEFLQKIFGNQQVDDQPFPDIPPHTHDGENSSLLAPSSIDSLQIKAGAVDNIALADDSVNSDKIIDSAVLNQHINALAVTEQKLADAAVATAKIRNGAVNASKLIQSEAVVTLSAQIDTAVIIGAHIGTGVIQNAHLGNAIISSAKIVDGAIINAKIGDAQITSAKIGLAEVQNANIENLAVSAAKIQDLAVTNAKIANLAVDNAKISSVCADKITAGTINLTSSGYLATPYGGIRIGYLRQVNGVSTYGLQAGPGHGLMLDDGGNGYARIWIDTAGNRPLCIDTTANDRIFFKASSGNDIMRLYGNNAVGGGFVDILTSLRIGNSQPSDPVEGQMYWERDPSGMGSGGRLMIYNGYSWHGVAWFDDI